MDRRFARIAPTAIKISKPTMLEAEANTIGQLATENTKPASPDAMAPEFVAKNSFAV
jgi:hypothetical protein